MPYFLEISLIKFSIIGYRLRSVTLMLIYSPLPISNSLVVNFEYSIKFLKYYNLIIHSSSHVS